MGGPSHRTEKCHKQVMDLWNEKVEQREKIAKENGLSGAEFLLSTIYEEISEELGYAMITVRLIIAGTGTYHKIKEARKKNRERICLLYRKKTSVGI